MEFFNVYEDKVIHSTVSVGATTYEIALRDFYPLIDRFNEQRKIQSLKFYERLKKDIIKGCIMPSITLAFIDKKMSSSKDLSEVQDYVGKNITSGYVLDGMQRLNTLKLASTETDFDEKRSIFFNIIIAKEYDLLLYRMITLNNGQRPMSMRHQMEVLTRNLLEKIKNDSGFHNINILTEKDTEKNSPKGAFKMSEISSAYLAFVTNSLHNQNNKFIQEKLDEIIVGRVMASTITDENISFSDVLKQVDRVASNDDIKSWFRNENHLIGFSVGVKKDFQIFKNVSVDKLKDMLDNFDIAFNSVNPSKVNVGKFRRELTKYLFENISKFLATDNDKMAEAFNDFTAI